MINLIAAFSIFNFSKDRYKNLNKKILLNNKISVHRRRDLDSLGDFIKF